MPKKSENNDTIAITAESNEQIPVSTPTSSGDCPVCSLERLWNESTDEFKEALVQYIAEHPFLEAVVRKAMEPTRFSIVNFQRHLNELSWRFDQWTQQNNKKSGGS
ncbi:MAG: hypothetical protein KatS3mg087_1757 [Patescibacteria group bacterium]|nr:MAG: hypothetical protein KatS3mg087_1757 [Patescibacteria group bacterium]